MGFICLIYLLHSSWVRDAAASNMLPVSTKGKPSGKRSFALTRGTLVSAEDEGGRLEGASEVRPAGLLIGLDEAGLKHYKRVLTRLPGVWWSL